MININNKSYVGRNIVINNGQVIVDGKNVTPENTTQIEIKVTGNVETLDVDHCDTILIAGDVNTVTTGSGDVNANIISSGARTGSGDIECKTINGNVQTGSGDVTTETISGTVKTGSGDVIYKK
jgi:hypothetical protein